MRFDFLLFICNRVVAYLPSWAARRFFYHRLMQFRLSPTTFVMMGAWFDCRRYLSIGARTIINRNCSIDNRGGIDIGSDVLISPEVMLITADHEMNSPDCRGRTRPIRIEDHVFIGSRAMIMPGVNVGRGAVVCAGAVVTRSVEPMSIVAGVPSVRIAMRDSTLEYQTTYSRWYS